MPVVVTLTTLVAALGNLYGYIVGGFNIQARALPEGKAEVWILNRGAKVGNPAKRVTG